MELVIIEERKKNIKTKRTVTSSCNRISDSQSDESVGGVQRIVSVYTECNRRNGPDFGRVFLMLNYTEKTPKHLYPKLNGLGDNGQ